MNVTKGPRALDGCSATKTTEVETIGWAKTEPLLGQLLLPFSRLHAAFSSRILRPWHLWHS